MKFPPWFRFPFGRYSVASLRERNGGGLPKPGEKVPSTADFVTWGVRIAGAAAILIGGFWLAAWLGGYAARWSAAGQIIVKTNMALGQILAGVSLLLVGSGTTDRARKIVGTALALMVLALGALTLIEGLFDHDLGIDQLLAREAPGALATVSPNRMGYLGSLSLVLLGAGLLALALRRRAVVPYLGLGVCVVNLLPAVGFLYRMVLFYRQPMTGIAWPSVVALSVLGLGLVLARRDGGPMALLLRDDPGGSMLRRLLPAALLVPLVLGIFHLQGERLALSDTATGTGGLMIVMVLLLSAPVFWAANALSRADIARRETETQLRNQAELMDHALEPLIVREVGGAIRTWNRGAEALYGWTAAQVLGRNTHDFLRTEGVPPDQKDVLLERAGHWEGELVRTARDGRRVIVESRQTATRTPDGHWLILESDRDITDRKQKEQKLSQVNRTLTAHGKSSHALMRATEETAYLQEICRIVVDDCHHAMAWIGYAEHDEAKTIRPVAYAGFEAGYLETLQLTWADTERGRGPTGAAIRTGQPDGCPNVLTDPRFAPWRAEAIVRGYNSSIVLPLRTDGKAFGALSIYSRQPEAFTETEVELLSRLADDLAYGITSLQLRAAQAQTETELAKHRQHLEEMVQQRTAELQRAMDEIRHAEAALKEANETLERHVDERTAELQTANLELETSRRAALNLVEDATEARREVEKTSARLQESEARLKRAQEIAHVGSWELDLVNGRLSWSDEVYRIFGLDPQAFAATYEAFLEAIHPDDRAAVDAAYSQSVRDNRDSYEIEHRVVRKASGEVRFVQERARHFRDANGRIIRSVGMVQDITERKKTEDALRFLLQCGVSSSGEGFFPELARYLAQVLGMDFVCIDRLEEDLLFAQTVAVFHNGQFEDNVAYALKDTPCGKVVGQRVCCFPRNVRELFPKDAVLQEMQAESYFGTTLWSAQGKPIGLIAVIGRQPLADTRMVESILQLVAVRAAGELERQEAEARLKLSLREKEVLLKEVHHRVKNNLQIITSLVSLQADSLNDPALHGVLQDVRDRVRSMALVHEKLYQSGSLAQVDFAEYARSLLHYLWRAHGSAAQTVRLQLELQPVTMSADTAVPCGLLLNELVTNALKHAFIGRAEGDVTVTLNRNPDRRVSLGVRDNGVGLPPGLDWRQSHSLGLKLVQMLAGQVSATVEVKRDAGTEFLVLLAPFDTIADKRTPI